MINRVDIVYGLAWGDEGKGKISSALAKQYDYVCRWNGGPNAGHTVYLKGKKYKTIVIGKKLGEGYKLKGTQDGINYELEVIKPLDDKKYGYTCYVMVLKQVGGKTKGIDKNIIFDEKSEGFIPNKNNNK